MKMIVLFIIILMLGTSQSHDYIQPDPDIRQSNILILISTWIFETINPEDINLNTTNNDEIVNSTKYNTTDDQNVNGLVKNDTSTNTVSLSAINNVDIHKNNTAEKEEETVKCTENDERYPISTKCDSYIECRNGVAQEKRCPDGLRYNPKASSDQSPCVYPVDIECKEGATLQTPQPTVDCPNQFGYFKIEDQYNCSSFRVCENGISTDYKCPFGLAFNIKNYRCDFPDKVPHCRVEEYLDFRCPVRSMFQKRITGYRYPRNCNQYYHCVNGKPRLAACDEFFGFEEASQRCLRAFLVYECTKDEKLKSEEHFFGDSRYEANRNVNIRLSSKNKPKPKVIS